MSRIGQIKREMANPPVVIARVGTMGRKKAGDVDPSPLPRTRGGFDFVVIVAIYARDIKDSQMVDWPVSYEAKRDSFQRYLTSERVAVLETDETTLASRESKIR